MNSTREKLEDIPGTYVFTRERCREGLHLNMFFTSLLKAENRKAFMADEKMYLDRYTLTAEQRRCVMERDWIGMLKAGANIYHLSKLGATDGCSFQYLAACMSGMPQEEYRNMMVRGGRSIEGNRSKESREPEK
ncbi:MAG TPA: protocatechuate 4,5-dioxygenase subunit alpha [Verrucomicrobiae bacterium]|jgi:protocatechuate 4,5-dioxygenase alpha chain